MGERTGTHGEIEELGWERRNVFGCSPTGMNVDFRMHNAESVVGLNY